MAKFNSRRLSQGLERFAGRSWEDVAPRMEELFERILQQTSGGIPPGFNNLDPTTIDGTAPASPGTETSGWAAADHVHALDVSGVPGDVGDTNAQGAGPGVSLSGHTHALSSDFEYLLWVL